METVQTMITVARIDTINDGEVVAWLTLPVLTADEIAQW